MVILGLDPGLADTGWGVIESQGQRFKYLAHGVIKTPASQTLSDRLLSIYGELEGLVARFAPNEASIEGLFFAKNVSSAIPVAHARGVLMLALSQKSVPVFEYTPLVIKQSLVGVGRAEKDQVGAMVKFFLGLSDLPKPNHAADALACSICHAHHSAGRA